MAVKVLVVVDLVEAMGDRNYFVAKDVLHYYMAAVEAAVNLELKL